MIIWALQRLTCQNNSTVILYIWNPAKHIETLECELTSIGVIVWLLCWLFLWNYFSEKWWFKKIIGARTGVISWHLLASECKKLINLVFYAQRINKTVWQCSWYPVFHHIVYTALKFLPPPANVRGVIQTDNINFEHDIPSLPTGWWLSILCIWAFFEEAQRIIIMVIFW